MPLPADRAPIVARLKLEAALARCQNELYETQRLLARALERARAKRRKTKRKR